MVGAIWRRVRALILDGRLEREMGAEMDEHIERSVERLKRRGLSEDDARREAAREFGNIGYLREEGRIARGTAWFEAVLGDARYAGRQYRRRAGTSAVMLIVLVAGIGIDIALFSFVRSYATAPVPGVAPADDLVRIRGTFREPVRRPFSAEELDAYRDLTSVFSSVAAWADGLVTFSDPDDAAGELLTAEAVYVNDEYFETIGVRPLIGPGFEGGDGDATGSRSGLLLSHYAWQTLFDGNRDVIGRTLSVNGLPIPIVGVAPEGFTGLGLPDSDRLSTPVFWIPEHLRTSIFPDPDPISWYGGVARLRPGVTRASATQATAMVAARFVDPPLVDVMRSGGTTAVVPLLAENADADFEQNIWIQTFFLGLAGLLVLLITCLNASTLLTGIAASRQREIGIRLSIGASRGRVVRQMLTESTLLAAVAGAFGLLLAIGIIHVVNVRITGGMLSVDGWAIVSTLGIVLATGIVFGLAPALHATRIALADAIRGSATTHARSRTPLQRTLVTIQIAATQPLVVGIVTLLMIFYTAYMSRPRHPYADEIATIQLGTRTAGAETADSTGVMGRMLRIEEVRERFAGMPGVRGASTLLGLQIGDFQVPPADQVEGGVDVALMIVWRVIDEHYLAVMGRTVVRTPPENAAELAVRAADGRRTAPALIGAELARTLWPGVDPIGRLLEPRGELGYETPTLLIVGLLDEPIRGFGYATDSQPAYVLRTAADSIVPTSVMVRTSGPAVPQLPGLRRIVNERFPELGITRTSTIGESEREDERLFRTGTLAVLGGGAAVLFLAGIGLYAVIAFAVRQRMGEIAVRMTVGASPAHVSHVFLREGARVGAIGLLFGLPLSLAGLHLLMRAGGFLPPIPLLPIVVAVVVSVLTVSLAASWVPAARAARVNPAVILRRD